MSNTSTASHNLNYGLWKYDPEVGLYFWNGGGRGYTWTEIEHLEDEVETYEERKRRKIAEQSEY